MLSNFMIVSDTMKKFYILLFLFLASSLASCAQKQVYIVHFGEHSGNKTPHEIENNHHSYLFSVKKTKEEARGSLLYSYKHIINGFAALLTPDQASKLSELEEVVSIWPSDPNKYKLHTTRSWKFSGLETDQTWLDPVIEGDLLASARYGKSVIVGLLDTGIWPEARSFSDYGMGSIPKSWKGICQTGPDFNSSHCNKKIIGARYYVKGYENHFGLLNPSLDYRSPRDKDGHGTHTASTVGGRRVHNAAALGGFARGTASGGASLVHLAIYKVCWSLPNQSKAYGNTCFEEDMFAAMDDAVADGVDILSISIGNEEPVPYNKDPIAMGALIAMKKNIVVACSAGNSGPRPQTLSNIAPWMITVGASSLDRDFIATVQLGNGLILQGKTVTPNKLKQGEMYPLVYAADVVGPYVSEYRADQCLEGSLIPDMVKGKIVLCMQGQGSSLEKGLEVKNAGGVGLILGNSEGQGNKIHIDPHLIPATAVTNDDAFEIYQYIRSTYNPVATIRKAKTMLNTKPAPSMASFSSRGPNVIDPYILKPDITAPGLNILAAWSEDSSPTQLGIDHRFTKFNLLSGTSMSCPHVAAAAALIKAIHPTWSSPAIRSALMTTATMYNNMGSPIIEETGKSVTPFAYGSGHFRPTEAADPGLVYDASYTDYLSYLCSLGMNSMEPKYKCPTNPISPQNLNYPSLAIPSLNDTITVTRTVTNVGDEQSTYYFSRTAPHGISVKAEPSILQFDHVGQKKSFNITLKARRNMFGWYTQDNDEYRFGWYTWSDERHIVRSPIAVSLA